VCHDLRLGFAGTPEFAARILQALLDHDIRPAVVYCQPDRPGRRGRRLLPPPVKFLAQAHGLPVHQPDSLRAPAEAVTLAAYALDVLVVAAYGLILPKRILDLPRFGCLNVHASLLPRWRGAAPIERAILEGDRETGVCIMQMDAGLDTGPVVSRRPWPIAPGTDAPALSEQLASLGADMLLDCLAAAPPWPATPQDGTGVTYAHKLTRADARVVWAGDAGRIARQVLALAGRMPPSARTNDMQVRLLAATAEQGPDGAPAGTIVAADADGIRVACGRGVLRITRLQLSAGKGRPMRAADAVNGYPGLFAVGYRLLDGAAP
jgi:methionyl-tRNA formyltransferase